MRRGDTCSLMSLGPLSHQLLEDTDLGAKDWRRLPGGSDPNLSLEAGVKACPRNQGNKVPEREDKKQRHGDIKHT